MAEDVARAVGAKGPVVKLGDREYQIRPLTIRELTELERDCLERYKRSYLQTHAKNADLIYNGNTRGREEYIKSKIEEASKWDVTTLPVKAVYDVDQVKVTAKLKIWLTNHVGFSKTDELGHTLSDSELDTKARRLIATALDNGTLTEEKYEDLAGSRAKKVYVGYVNWWVTATVEGMISMIWMCFKDAGVSRDAVAQEIGKNPELLVQVSREIERLSAPAEGNG